MNERPYIYYNGMVTAALICGIIGICTALTGVLPLIFGGLGLLFLYFGNTPNGYRDSRVPVVRVLCIIVLVVGAVLIITTLIKLPAMLNDPSYRSILNNLFYNMYGTTFDEMFNQSSGNVGNMLNNGGTL